MSFIWAKHCIRSMYCSVLAALFCLCLGFSLFLYSLCWWESIYMAARDPSAKKKKQKKPSITHTHVHNTRGDRVGRLWDGVCVCVCTRVWTEWGSGQVALTLHCLGPSRATDPVSNSPLLAVLMWATSSYHTICSEHRSALLSPDTHIYSNLSWTVQFASCSDLIPPQTEGQT